MCVLMNDSKCRSTLSGIFPTVVFIWLNFSFNLTILKVTFSVLSQSKGVRGFLKQAVNANVQRCANIEKKIKCFSLT